MSSSINIGIAGLGTIGCGVVNNLLRNQESLKEKYGIDFEIIGVSASNKTKIRSINLEDFNWYDDPIDLAKDKNIDLVIPFGSRQELEQTIELYSPDILLVGGDWRDGDVVGREYAKEVRFFNRVGGYSTTDIIDNIVNKYNNVGRYL